MKLESRDKQEIINEEIEIIITLPRWQSGEYTYGGGEYRAPALCVYYNDDYDEYSLNHQIYLDYKDSLQVGMDILRFENKEQAVAFASKHKLNTHNF